MPDQRRNSQYSSRARTSGTRRNNGRQKTSGEAPSKSSKFFTNDDFSSKTTRSSKKTNTNQPRQRSRNFDYTRLTASKNFFTFLVFGAIGVAIVGQLFVLQVIKADEYSTLASNERTADIITEPRRGTIYDCNGNILAISVDAADIYCDATKVTDAQKAAEALATILGKDDETKAEYLSILSSKTLIDSESGVEYKNTFSYLARGVTTEQSDALMALEIDGLGSLPTTVRKYPYGQTGGQVIGCCSPGEDNVLVGISGLEKYYDDILSGTAGHYTYERSRTGEEIPGGVILKESAVDGQSIMVSLDIELQAQVEAALVEAAARYEASSTSCIIMDGSTGEIRVAASLPLFNPADRSVVEDHATEVRGFTEAIEPGSIFKTITAMTILEEDAATPDTEFFCKAVLEFPNLDGTTYYISDAHDRGDETMTFRDIVDRSSNVGIGTALVESFGSDTVAFQKFYEAIKRYNLNDYTGIDWDESVGYLLEPFESWSAHQSYCMTFGQGLSVTPLQMVRFYGALVNNGYETTPHFLVKNLSTQETPTYEQVEVIENKNAISTMNDMLTSVVTDGTGWRAAIDGYTVAGKTSTAEIADPDGGYKEGVYNLGFISYLPNSNSDLVFYVGAADVPYETTMTIYARDIMVKTIERYRIAEKTEG